MRRLAIALLTTLLLAGCSPIAPTPPDGTPVNLPEATPVPTVTAAPTDSPLPTPARIKVTLYVPNTDATGLVTRRADAVDSPRGLINALVEAGALPDVGYTIIAFSEGDDHILRLDLPDAFAQVVLQAGSAGESLLLQSLANTFLTRYGADGLILTIGGKVLETGHDVYEDPIRFDALAETLGEQP